MEDGEIRRAYLRMMSRYHPDKLIASDLSPSDRQDAKEMLERCREAYRLIQKSRGQR